MTLRITPLAMLLTMLVLTSALPASAADKPADDDRVRAIIGVSGTAPTQIPGLEVVRVSPQGGYVAVEAPSPQELRLATASLPGVLYVEGDETLTASAVPNDSRYSSQYGPAQMGTEQAWTAVGYGDASISVAVLDTGLRRTHQDFTPAARIAQTAVYTGNANDNCGHGTHVAGTVGATTGNGLGVAGMSQARIMPYKVLDATGGLLSAQCSGSTSAIAQAVYDATDAGADIISMSLGGGGFSQTFSNAVNYAWSHGVLVVAASGNDGASNGVSYPAAYPNAIAVGALDASKNRASYSNGGPELDVVAPGSSVMSTYNGSDSSYSSLSGTSMATPHVAGALALAWSCAPAGTTNTTMRQALESTTEDLGATGFDTAYGHGLVRADLLVAEVCDGGVGDPDPVNTAPVAAFTTSTADLTVDVDASSSTDADGDALSYAWTFGDGATATGVNASHTYSSAGTYPVSLTVTDGNGGTDTTLAQVTVQAAGGGGDPDPATPTITTGQPVTVTLDGSGDEAFYKVEVPAGTTSLTVTIDGPSCGLFGCSFDADLYTRAGQRPTDSAYDCRPFASGSDESCTRSNPPAGFTYIRVDSYSGSGSLKLTAQIS